MIEDYKKLFIYADRKETPKAYAIKSLIVSFVVALLAAFILKGFYFPFIITLIIVFVLINILFYYLLVLSADKRARTIESIMPDFLLLLSSNLKAGLTMDRAMVDAARPEFGNFSVLIKKVGKEIRFGKNLGSSLMIMSKQVKSEKLLRTMRLIKDSLKAGGETVILLEQIATSLKSQQLSQEKVKNSVLTYILFITLAITLGAPLLFGLSSFLIEYMKELFAGISLPETTTALASPAITLSGVSLSSRFVLSFIMIFLFLNAIIGSLVLGELRKGKGVYGLRYMPMLLIASFAVFFLIRVIVRQFAGGFF